MLHLFARSRLAALVSAVATSALAIGLFVATAAQAATGPVVGPDISRWQHPYGAAIDFAKVKAAGNSFVIIKATEGSTDTSPYYAGDAAAARANGLAVGAYHYARPALPMSTAAEQAQRFAATMGNMQMPATLPPILDLETTGGLSPGELVTWAQIFTETLRAASGRTPVVYTYVSFWNTQMAGSRAFSRSPLWLAFYRPYAPPVVGGWPSWSLWQHTASARVPGIVGNVDMNRFAGDATAFAAFADGTVATPWPLTAPLAPVAVKGSPGARSASVRWVPSDDGGEVATSYTVTITPGGSQVTLPGTSTTASFTGLTEGTAYSFTVTATNRLGTSPVSGASVPVTARGDAPAAPTALLAEVDRGSVALSWDPGAVVATSYAVSRCSPAPCTPTTVVASVPAPLPSYVDTAVVGGVTYAYAVASVNASGTSAPSGTVQATPLPTVDRLDAPTGLVAQGAGGAVNLAWTPVPHAAKYQVLRCDGAACAPTGAPVATIDVPIARTSQAAAGGSTFTYSVVAIAGPLVSAPSSYATGTALIAQSLRVMTSPATPEAGRPVKVTVKLTRADTRAALGGRTVTLAVVPARGRAPAPITLRTSATGVASVVLAPQVNAVVVGRSAARDLLAVGTRANLRVRPVLTSTLSRSTVKRNTKVVLSGRTSTLFAGERVVRQVLLKGRWRTVASVPVNRAGQYRFTLAAAGRPGGQQMRVYVGASPRHLAGASRWVKLIAR